MWERIWWVRTWWFFPGSWPTGAALHIWRRAGVGPSGRLQVHPGKGLPSPPRVPGPLVPAHSRQPRIVRPPARPQLGTSARLHCPGVFVLAASPAASPVYRGSPACPLWRCARARWDGPVQRASYGIPKLKGRIKERKRADWPSLPRKRPARAPQGAQTAGRSASAQPARGGDRSPRPAL